ncbi:2,5-diamino-6-(ribosylamino)-4(3H)-pyrimidinone 5'-phosphate reductase [Rhizophlyctis rosea]|nr:2,5-diamino-6-(ribosylamino)-4(3H)-pyrimidinone 5'-phosphate reductase [Rhizophlyctis rosea]
MFSNNRKYDFCMCNPPFYDSREQLEASRQTKELDPFAICTGTEGEMITEGGELQFVTRIINESVERRNDIRWFTSLLGRKEDVGKLSEILEARNLKYVVHELRQAKTVRWVIGWTYDDGEAESKKRSAPPTSDESAAKKGPLEGNRNLVLELSQTTIRKYQQRQPGPDFELKGKYVNWTPAQFLLHYPPGAYTVARTLITTSIVDLPAHIDRIVSSLRLIQFNQYRENLDDGSVAVSSPQLKEKEDAAAESALAVFRERDVCADLCTRLWRKVVREYLGVVEGEEMKVDGMEKELMVMVLVAYSCKEVKVVAYCADLPKARTTPLNIWIYGSPRDDPTPKDSLWVRTRKPIEDAKPSDVGEVLLTDREGNLYEGLRTNFCAVVKEADGRLVVITAPSTYVLMGTMLAMVQAACLRAGIPFRFDFPKVEGIRSWVGAFVTSVNNRVTPVGSVRIGTDSNSITLPHCPLLDEIRTSLWTEMQSRATPLLTTPTSQSQLSSPPTITTEQQAYAFLTPLLSTPTPQTRPKITLTYAQTLDGFIAGPNKTPLQISCPESMVLTHALRASHDAILVGISTVLADSPSLTTRFVTRGPGGESPATHPRPIVLDSRLRCPLNAKFMGRSPIIIASEASYDPERKTALERVGASVILLPSTTDKLPLENALPILAAEPYNVKSIMVEGGAGVIGYCLREGSVPVDLCVVTVAPVWGGEGVRCFEGAGPAGEGEGGLPRLEGIVWEGFGRDSVVAGRVVK